MEIVNDKGIAVWRHLKNGKRKAVVLKREHVCTKECLRIVKDFGRDFSYCARYSYRKPTEF